MSGMGQRSVSFGATTPAAAANNTIETNNAATPSINNNNLLLIMNENVVDDQNENSGIESAFAMAEIVGAGNNHQAKPNNQHEMTPALGPPPYSK